MKRFLALALSAILVLSLAACASVKASNDGGSTTDEPAAIEEPGGMAVGGSATLMNIADLDIGSFCEYGGVENDDVGGETVQIANPFVDYKSLDEAVRAAGFALTAPETVEGWDGEKLIQVMSGSMIQIIFHDGGDNRLFVRKEADSADISGDYNSYAEVKTVSVNGCDVTTKGSDSMVSTAIWTNSGYSYAVMSDIPMSADAMTALVAQVG